MTYLAYTGIGSRKTPTHIQAIMRHIGGYLCSQGWVLRSGAAQGADTAFEDGAKAHDPNARQEIYLPWVGFNHHPSDLHPRNIPFSQAEMDLSAQMHPAWDKCSPSARLLHQRNLRQLLGCEAVSGEQVVASKFVVCWTEGGLMKGGTAQALRIAQACNIPIVNFGRAANAEELEKLILEVDQLQTQFKTEFQSTLAMEPDHEPVSENRR